MVRRHTQEMQGLHADGGEGAVQNASSHTQQPAQLGSACLAKAVARLGASKDRAECEGAEMLRQFQ